MLAIYSSLLYNIFEKCFDYDLFCVRKIIWANFNQNKNHSIISKGEQSITMKRLPSIFLVVAMILSLAACTSAPIVDNDTNDGTNTNTPAQSTSSDRWIRIGRTMANTLTLDVFRTTLAPVYQLSDAIFDRLLDKNPKTMELELNLLQEWPTVSDDGLTYSFKLKEGVKWHDGKELTTKDVEFTFNYFYDKDTASDNTYINESILGCLEMEAGESDYLEGMKIIDDYSFELTLYYPYAPFLATLATSALPILPAHLRPEAGDAWGTSVLPVGSGPYKVISFEPGVEVVLETNKDYHGTVPNCDGIIITQMEPSTALMEFEAGNIDFCEVPADIKSTYEEAFPNNFHSQVLAGTIRFSLNNSMEPLNDVRVRKAIAMSVSKHEIVDGYFGGSVVAINGVIPEGIAGFDPTIPETPTDYEAAKALLAEAGYPNGVEFTATIRESSDFVPLIQLLQSQLANAGITMNIEKVDSATYSEMRNSNRIQANLGDWYADYMDADMYMYALFHSSFSDGFSIGFHDDWFDEQVEYARSCQDNDERTQIYKDLDRYLSVEQYVFVPLYQDQMFYLTSDRIENVFIKADMLYNFQNASVKE